MVSTVTENRLDNKRSVRTSDSLFPVKPRQALGPTQTLIKQKAGDSV